MSTHTLTCPECGNPMVLCPTGKWGPYYRCSTYPRCPGAHGAHKDGTPLGVPANKATKQARIAAHTVFDALWKDGGMSRGSAYRWLSEALGLTPEECHIGRFDEAQCNRVIRLVWAREPEQE